MKNTYGNYEFDINQIIGNFIIGAAVIAITAFTIPVLAPTIKIKTVIAITVANTTGALANSAISGTIRYLETGGDLNQALISASNEFKWTSIFLSGGTVSSVVIAYKVLPALRLKEYERAVGTIEKITDKLVPNKYYYQYNADYPIYTKVNSAGRIDYVYAPELKLSNFGRKLHWTQIGDLENIGYEILKGDQGGHLFGDWCVFRTDLNTNYETLEHKYQNI